jgi:cell volume regulation protein A
LDSVATVNVEVLFIGLLLVVGIVSSLVAQRMGAPLLLFVLVIGMLAGEDGPGGIVFDNYRVTYFIGAIALAIILFDGGLRMRLARFRGAIAPAALLATAGVVITAGIAGLVAIPALGVSLPEGLLVGAIIASTDAAAVLFLLGAGGLQLKRRIGATLEIEAGVNDPTAVLLTILLVQVVLAQGAVGAAGIVTFLISQIVIGALVGGLGGVLIVLGLNRLSLPSGLPPLFVVAAAVTIFGAAAEVHGSGFFAVYLAGLIVGNRPVRAYPAVVKFLDAATWLAQIVMFLVLGLLTTPSRLFHLLIPALVIAAALMLLARPVAVWVCLSPFGFTTREKAFVSWVGLRGAVSILLAAIPVLSSAPRATMYFDMAFVVVLVSLILQGWTVAPAARRMGVARTEHAPSVNRVEIDLPGRLDLEMVGYPVQRDSHVLARGRLPRWLRPLLILREGDPLSPAEAEPMEAGDFAYFLAPRNRLRLLDRLFGPTDAVEAGRGEGLFSFRGVVRLDDVARLYGGSAPADLAGLTIAEAFDKRYAGGPEVGDRIDLGPAEIIASIVTAEGVVMTWLDLEPRGAAEAFSTSALTRGTVIAMRRIARRARRLIGKVAPSQRVFAGPDPKPNPASDAGLAGGAEGDQELPLEGQAPPRRSASEM